MEAQLFTLVPARTIPDSSDGIQPVQSSEKEVKATEDKQGKQKPVETAKLAKDIELGRELTASNSYPEGGLEAWLCVLGSFFMLLSTFGFMVSIGILQDYWRVHQLKGYSARDIGWIGATYTYLALALGFLVGPLFDRYGPRTLNLVGSVVYIICIFVLGECEEYWHFMLCLGVAGGVSVALLITSSVSAISHWFDKYRGRATGVALAGNSVGGTFIPLLMRATLPRYGWAWSMRILGFAILLCLIMGNIFVKGRLKSITVSAATSPRKIRFLSWGLFKDLRFTFLTVTIFGIEVVLFGGLAVLPTYATIQGYSPETGFYLISVLNGVSCLGRFLPGLLSDYTGRFNMFLLTIILTLVVMLTVWLPFGDTSLVALYVFSALFGFGTGSWMAMVPVCIGQLCRTEQFGEYWGTSYFFASMATLVCIPVGGQLVESSGSKLTATFFSIVLAVSLATFVVSRWACLEWRWRWIVKI